MSRKKKEKSPCIECKKYETCVEICSKLRRLIPDMGKGYINLIGEDENNKKTDEKIKKHR